VNRGGTNPAAQSYGRMKLTTFTDEELVSSIKSLVANECGCLVSILKHLAEFENRKLADRKGFPSLFDYCVRELHYAHGEAARRIRAARAADKYPIFYRLLERGSLSLTAVSTLEPHLKWSNSRKLIRSSIGLSTREIEALVASLTPSPAAPAERIRYLAVDPPVAPPAVDALFAPAVEPAPSPVAEGAPITNAARRVQFSFTADESLLRDVERAKELSRHKWPGGKLEDVFAGAIKLLLEKIDPDIRNRRKERARRLAAGGRSRNIPQDVKNEVWRRDGGRCAFKAGDGRVCGARVNLEFDHILPWALGGASGESANVRLLCRAHNDLEARRIFGGATIDAAVARREGALRRGVKI